MDIIQNSLGAVILIILIKIALDIFIIACISVTARSTKTLAITLLKWKNATRSDTGANGN